MSTYVDDDRDVITPDVAAVLYADVPALTAEVERLRGELAEQDSAVLELLTKLSWVENERDAAQEAAYRASELALNCAWERDAARVAARAWKHMAKDNRNGFIVRLGRSIYNSVARNSSRLNRAERRAGKGEGEGK